jgi:nucleotide-binding universal stress UspA family protein
MPRTFVVPLDGSHFAERAIPVADALARRVDGRILLLTTHWDSELGPAAGYLERTAAGIGDGRTDVMLVQDRPGPEAIEMVAAGDGELLVCMTTHGRGGLRWAVLGSVAEEVVRKSRHPVLLVGTHCPPEWPTRFEHVVACVGGGDADAPIVPLACEWARALDLDVHVTHVIHPLDVEQPPHADEMLGEIVGKLESEGVRAKPVVLRRSFVPGALADYAATSSAAMLVMTSHARTGITRVALGSVAMGTVALSPVPVLVTNAA